ncbi:MAG: ribonucleoside-diphosphate reductase, adenosylcobalamin-dependent, partial [Rhodospirillales bacterium]
LPDAFVDAQELSPNDHLVMQAAVQKYVDSSISKTINCPESISFEDFKDIYMQAFELGCKGCTTFRPNEITGAVLEAGTDSGEGDGTDQHELPLEVPAAKARPRDIGDSGAVVHMFQPLDRPEALPGATYKVHWPESEHAIYITLNDLIDDNGRRRPFEVFINSKNMEHYAWTVALTRMISAVFRRGGDVSFVVDELKAVFDPRGGHWMGGRYIPSLLAAIGEVIERHMIAIGFLAAPGTPAGAEAREKAAVAAMGAGPGDGAGANGAPFRQCPKCGQASLIHQEGCDICTICTYSKCG